MINWKPSVMTIFPSVTYFPFVDDPGYVGYCSEMCDCGCCRVSGVGENRVGLRWWWAVMVLMRILFNIVPSVKY